MKNMKKNITLSIFFPLFFILNTSYAQNQSVGLFTNELGSLNGYTLFTPNENTYLIDNCGRLVHSWQSTYNSGKSVYLLENGDLLRTCYVQNNIFSGGGSGGRIEKRSWDNTLLWSYNFSNSNYYQHHDIEPMPNGNILVLCWEYKSLVDAILAGRDPSSLADNELWPTYIIEVEPVGSNSINIVWEWHLWDHLIQDIDPSKPNYGVVANHPEKLDVNFYKGNGKKDWLHCNSIDYNSELDQIVISSRALSEFYIIDHSTTTAQAATSSGGNFGKGGDFLYRWGNPASYDNGSNLDQKLFGQHDVQWIENNFLDGGKIILFNNGQGRDYSSIDIISPLTDVNGNYILNNNLFGPIDPEWVYTDVIPNDFYASFISGVQRLSNGNTLICDGPHGTFFEIDSLKNIVWEYVNPIANGIALSQGSSIPTGNNGWANSTFQCTKYPVDYPAFNQKDLTPGPYIEINPILDNCEILISLNNTNISSSENKSLVKIVDIFGRNTEKQNNTILFFIYDDGTIEKKMFLD